MRNLMIKLVCTPLFLLAACSTQPQLYGSNKTDNFAREIKPVTIFHLDKEWALLLKRQPIKPGKGKPHYDDLLKAQELCNNFTWAFNQHWSTPLEAKKRGSGDCKDAAICKYYYLRSVGWEPNQLNLWSGWYGKHFAEHMTLAVRIGKDQFVLDNTFTQPLKAKDFMHSVFEPYSRFNEIGWDF